MASRIRSPLSPSSNQFRQKPVQRAKRNRSQDHKRTLNKKDSWKKKWPALSLLVRQNLLARTPLKRAGRKTKEWDRIRAVLKKRFKAAGIMSCEVGRPGCWRTESLGFAHMDKRRFLTEAELWIAILACSPVCHDWLEKLPRTKMKKAVLKIIRARPVQP